VTIDHRTPRSRGGSDDLGNLQLAHRVCNNCKNAAAAPTREQLELAWGREERRWRIYCKGLEDEPCGSAFFIDHPPREDDELCDDCRDAAWGDPNVYDSDGNALEHVNTGVLLSVYDLGEEPEPS
jgi:hypothetical protein